MEDFLWSRKEEFLVRDLYSFFGENSAFTTIVLAKEDLPDRVLEELRQRIRKAMPPIGGARVYFREEAEEGGSTTYFSVRLFGNDVEGLNQWALDPDRARRLGLAPQDMADVFAFTLGGLRLPRYNAGEREVEMNVSLALEDRENLADLRQLVVQTPGGLPVQLGDIADFQVVPRAQTIERENRKIKVQVNAVFEGKNFGPTREKITETMNALGLPPGITWSWNQRGPGYAEPLRRVEPALSRIPDLPCLDQLLEGPVAAQGREVHVVPAAQGAPEGARSGGSLA